MFGTLLLVIPGDGSLEGVGVSLAAQLGNLNDGG